jgi:ubiquitin fusion degradation protein 1
LFSILYNFLVILPQSALEQLSNYNIEYPMIFKITNDRNGASSHCGVLEFSAKEGVSYIPGWVKKQHNSRIVIILFLI